MFRKFHDDFTDDDFNNIILPFNKNVDSYINDNIIYQFIAFYIASGYERSALWETNFKTECDSAIEYLTDLRYLCTDMDKIKHYLEVNYSLKIISEKPLVLEKIEYK